MNRLLATLTAAVLSGQYVARILRDIAHTIRAGGSRSLAAALSNRLKRDQLYQSIIAITGKSPEMISALIAELVIQSGGVWSFQQAADIVGIYAAYTGQLPQELDLNDPIFYRAARASGAVREVRPEDIKIVVSAVWIKAGYGYHFSAN